MNNFSTSLLGTLTAIILSAIAAYCYYNPSYFSEFIRIFCILTMLIGGGFLIAALVFTLMNIYNFIGSFFDAIMEIFCLEMDEKCFVTINKYKFSSRYGINLY